VPELGNYKYLLPAVAGESGLAIVSGTNQLQLPSRQLRPTQLGLGNPFAVFRRGAWYWPNGVYKFGAPVAGIRDGEQCWLLSFLFFPQHVVKLNVNVGIEME